MELAKALRKGGPWQRLLNPEKLRLYAKHFNFDMPEIANKVLQFAEDWPNMTTEEKKDGRRVHGEIFDAIWR